MKKMRFPSKQVLPSRTFMSISWRKEHLGMEGTYQSAPQRQYDNTRVQPVIGTPGLVEFVRADHNRLQKQEALLLLSSRQEAGVDECLEWVLANSKDGFLRAQAVRAAGWRYGETSLRIIRKGLDDPEPDVREEAERFMQIWSLSGITQKMIKKSARKDILKTARENTPARINEQPLPPQSDPMSDQTVRPRTRRPGKRTVA